MSHTPGPWKNLGEHVVDVGYDGITSRFALIGPEPSAVAWVNNDPIFDEGAANVALIAAAPDLLAALLAVEQSWNKIFGHLAIEEQVKAAIAKATGKEGE